MEPYIAEIRMFAGTYAPQGWATCEGQLLSISKYDKLFSLINTIYGGDGVSNFAVPDLRGRSPIHWGQGKDLSAHNIGDKIGKENVILSQGQMPAHSHQVNGVSAAANQSAPGGFYPSLSNDPLAGTLINSYSSATPDQQMNAGVISTVGESQAVPISSPALTITFIIALDGIWPPRP